jgi:hypothetical protein
MYMKARHFCVCVFVLMLMPCKGGKIQTIRLEEASGC